MRNSIKAKRASVAKLDRVLNKQGLEFLTEPRFAQKVCMLLGWKYAAYLFILGMGAGKTKLTLDLFRNRRRTGEAKRCLVLVPNIVNLGAWEEEVALHAHDVSFGMINQKGADARWTMLLGDSELVVMTYQGFAQLLSKKVEVQGKGNKLKKSDRLVDTVARSFQMLILDESTFIKNPKSLSFMLIRRMRKLTKFCYALTGTPFNKSPIDLWSQFYAIDNGYTLGETLGLFRESYFRKEQGAYTEEWVFRKRSEPLLSRRIANCSVRFSEEECQDLPPAVGGITGNWMVRVFTLSPEQLPYHQKLKKDLEDSQGEYASIDSPYVRLRMVSSGWLGAKTPDGERVELEFSKNPKMDALIALLSEIPDNEKVIVVGWFNTSCAMIMDRLKKEKIKAALVNGQVSGSRKLAAVKAFKSEGGPRVLVGSTSMSKGLNLQGAARFMIFYESMDSTGERSQMEARVRREGGKAGIRYYYELCCAGGVEYRILKSLRTGRALHDVLLDWEG